MEKTSWKIRALQLDLARQMETLDEIRRFIDGAARFGFNSVALYLEGRVRTETFPWPAPEESYTPEEMREIVDYAAQREIEIIPIVSTLGHAELFLRYDKLKPLAELREGIPGRFQSGLCDFCPSTPETYRFLASYLRDLSEIFPSRFFHIGCDEVWDMGYCSLCAERIRNGEKIDDLYSRHIARIHQIVSGELGRQIMMWDDFLEELPEAIDSIPTDIIQCVWQYDPLVDQTKTHFGRRARDHRMAEYDRRGISYIIVPWTASGLRNTESLTTYAQRFHPVGGLLTLWENYTREDYINLAFAGRRWNNPQAWDGETICKQALSELFGLDEPLFLQAVWTARSMGPIAKHETPEAFLRGTLTPYCFERANSARLLIQTLESFRPKVQDSLGREVLEELILSLRRELVQLEIRVVVQGLYDGWNGGANHQSKLLAQGHELLRELTEIANLRQANWEVRRPSIPVTIQGNTAQFERNLRDRLATFLDAVESGQLEETGLLTIRYSLPDYYGCAFSRWSVQFEGSSDWVLINHGVPKPWSGDYSDCPFFTISHPLPSARIPLRARVEVTGYGGLGILYVEACVNGNRLHPVQVDAISGLVQHPNHIVSDDTAPCWLGDSSTKGAFHHPSAAKEVHSVEITFGC